MAGYLPLDTQDHRSVELPLLEPKAPPRASSLNAEGPKPSGKATISTSARRYRTVHDQAYLLKRVSDIEPDSRHFILLAQSVDSSQCLFLDGRIPVEPQPVSQVS